MMIRSILLVFMVGLVSLSWCQTASKFLNLDKTISVYYRNYSGDTVQYRYTHQEVFKSDTVCFYQRLTVDGDSIGVVYFAYNGLNLLKGNQMVTKYFRGPTELDLRITIPTDLPSTDTSYVISFDMDVSEFQQTARMDSNYTTPEQIKFNNVLFVDQYNLTEDYHYISIFAPGIGLVNQGKNELLFLFKEEVAD